MDFDSKTDFQSDLGALGSADGVVIPPGQSFSITELAEAFSITTRALRFYEDHDLLRPERRGQTRVYARADFARLAWVLRGKRVGFALAEIKEMLDLYDAGDGRAKQRAITLEKCRERLASLQAQRHDLNQMIEELAGFCSTLESMHASPKS
jgi:DNA-binding transcriptional MerR regulator